MKYHINPETGNVNVCAAKEGRCRFGANEPHYNSAEQAREAFELRMADELTDSSAWAKIVADHDRDAEDLLWAAAEADSDEEAEELLTRAGEVNVNDVAGIEIINRETGEVEAYTTFSQGEMEMPGYTDTVIQGYAGTAWEARPVSRGVNMDRDDAHCFVCSRHTDHTGEHDDLVEAGLAAYDEYGDVVRTEAYDVALARTVSNAHFCLYSVESSYERPSTPEIDGLREELRMYEARPRPYGFPEDELSRYHMAQAEAKIKDQIKSLDPSYDAQAERRIEQLRRAYELAVANAQYVTNPDYRYHAPERVTLPEGKTRWENVAVASAQYNQEFPGSSPESALEMGRKQIIVPNVGNLTKKRKLRIANELVRMTGMQDLRKWDAMSDEAKVSWVEPRIGKYDYIDLEVEGDHTSFSARYSSNNNSDRADTVMIVL